MLVGVVVLHDAAHLQDRRIHGIIQVLDPFRPGMHQIPQEADVPLHQVGHPPAGFGLQITEELLHQLGFAQPGRQIAPQQVPEVLQFRFLEMFQNAV